MTAWFNLIDWPNPLLGYTKASPHYLLDICTDNVHHVAMGALTLVKDIKHFTYQDLLELQITQYFSDLILMEDIYYIHASKVLHAKPVCSKGLVRSNS